jgi:hypothetical protein
MGSIFEALMLICFGASWPFSIIRSAKARSAKGKSIVFLVLLELAYISGIMHKLFVSFDYVIAFYIVNMIMVSIDIVLYIRNSKLDREAEGKEKTLKQGVY